LADIVAFNRAVDWRRHFHGSGECATLVEAILAVLGVEIRDADPGPAQKIL
jgi:hypothetical protein